jgi:hypothetical protein
MSEIVDRLRELVSEVDPELEEITVSRDEAADLLDLIDQLSDGTLGD